MSISTVLNPATTTKLNVRSLLSIVGEHPNKFEIVNLVSEEPEVQTMLEKLSIMPSHYVAARVNGVAKLVAWNESEVELTYFKDLDSIKSEGAFIAPRLVALEMLTDIPAISFLK